MAPPEAATEMKSKGNKCFSKHEWLNAIEFYTKAIDLYDQDPSYYCNRAQVILSDEFLFGTRDADTNPHTGQYQARTIWLCHCRCY